MWVDGAKLRRTVEWGGVSWYDKMEKMDAGGENHGV